MERSVAAGRIAFGLRWFAGLFYAFVAFNAMFHLTPMPEGRTPESSAFFAALHASGFMLPLLGLCFLIGGLLLLRDDPAPQFISRNANPARTNSRRSKLATMN